MPVVFEECSAMGIVVLTPTDELLTADVVHELYAHTDSTTPKHFILDLRAIRFLVSGSLYPHMEPIKPLFKLHQQLKQEGRRLVLCNLSSEIADVFRITKLDQTFEVTPDLNAALSVLDPTCITRPQRRQ